MLVRSIYEKKKKRYAGLGMVVETVLQNKTFRVKILFRTKHLELKCYSVSWNCTNIDAVILLKVCILAIGSYLPRKVAGYFEN